ncbi:Tfp assembly type protein [Sporosarcina sp. P20a]|uniref:type II secretion system protein n=1 Tax=Sporosarcina sp. P20a TaxID=2048256 RepID=UPI000C16DBF4|nr:prepilin-type N-terminal cleavage/methylation domain-containing protein [Sporosarcina sp. P20a]PIC87232.1 Tfp assembly type protein [Sporosarcina sp. P20a]
MKKFMQKKLNQKGLTLVELLAVIVILGIIAAIAVPAIGNIITNSKVSALKADGQNALSAANIYFAETTTATANTVTTTVLKDEGYLEDAGGFKDSDATITKGTGEVTTTTINGTSTNGNVSVKFEEASAADINAANNKTGGTNVVVSR